MGDMSVSKVDAGLQIDKTNTKKTEPKVNIPNQLPDSYQKSSPLKEKKHGGFLWLYTQDTLQSGAQISYRRLLDSADYSYKNIDGVVYEVVKGDNLTINNANNIIVSGKNNKVNGTPSNDNIVIENGEAIKLDTGDGDDKVSGTTNDSKIKNAEIVKLKDSNNNLIQDNKHKSQLSHTYKTQESTYEYDYAYAHDYAGEGDFSEVEFSYGLHRHITPIIVKDGTPIELDINTIQEVNSVDGLKEDDLKEIKQNYQAEEGENNILYIDPETGREILEKGKKRVSIW